MPGGEEVIIRFAERGDYERILEIAA